LKTLRIADDLVLPLEIVTEKVAFLGRTGSGKTYAAMKLAELMLEVGAQIVALDPVGVWYGLRIGGPWNVYIFGGLHGDFPLEPTSGALLADLIIDRGISVILDVSQFIPSEQQCFAKDFAHRFFHRKKASPSAVHLFMEECQEFIPENPTGLEAQTLGEFQRLWKLGRNFGIGGSLISQRPQEIAKKALNMSGTMFAFQMTGPQERKAVKLWVADKGIAVDIESVLQRLNIGQPHVESPTFLEVSRTVRILPKQTADVSSTPIVGARSKEQPLTSIDVEKFKSEMAETIERSKADDPKELRKQIAELRKQLSASAVDPAAVEKAEARGYDKAREQWADVYESAKAEIVHLRKQVQTIAEISAGLLSRDAPKTSPVHDIPVPARRPAPAVHKPAPIVHKPANSSHRADSSLSGAERRILTVLAQYPAGKDNTALAHLAGYTVNGHFNNMLGSLRSKGYANRGNPVTATPEGVAALGDYEPLPSGEDLRNYWRNKVSSSERRILDPLLDVYPNGLEPVELARRAGYTVNGHFNNMLGHLRTIEIVQRGTPIRASDTLFE
jgi:hypothetical protein